MSNYPEGAERDPAAPWNQEDDPECPNCGEQMPHDAERACEDCEREMCARCVQVEDPMDEECCAKCAAERDAA